MCGFLISNSPAITNKYSNLIETSLRFRGPDYSSGLVCFDNGWKAYHSRLSIIDITSTANQPFIDCDGGILVFNGEILNYKYLSSKYFDNEHKSDTKLLSDLIINDFLCLNELDGFFSFVYVSYEGIIKYSVRDKFGVKPLFYYEDNDGITFCSEPSVLKNIFNCKVVPEAINEYYATRAPIFSGSYFNNVFSVTPGNCYVNGEYFNCIDYLGAPYNDIDLVSLRQAFVKGIETRQVSDAPVGLLLSKGIDSNLMRCLGNFDNYYSIGFEGDEDLEYLKKQDIEGLNLITCSSSQYRDAFEYLLNLRGEPLSVPNEVLLYLIAKEASKHGIKVLLSGEGADEFFGGYDRIFNWANEVSVFNLDEFLEYYCYIKPAKNSPLYLKFIELFKEVPLKSPFEIVRWFFIRYHMPILFRRLDFALMAAGVEGREPIANIHTFIHAVSMSKENLMCKRLGKSPLREILSEFMGENFAYERKVGFPVNMNNIFEYDESVSSYEIWFNENLKVLEK